MVIQADEFAAPETNSLDNVHSAPIHSTPTRSFLGPARDKHSEVGRQDLAAGIFTPPFPG